MRLRPPPSARLPAELEALIAPAITLEKAKPELLCYTAIDSAHIVMLHRCHLIGVADAAALSRAVTSLADEHYVPLNGQEAPRGLYIAYEREIVHRAGQAAGSRLHTARSRNDLNATVAALMCRDWSARTLGAIDEVRRALLVSADRLGDTALPIFSQYQIAGPGQGWHYCASLETSLSRFRSAFQAVLDALQFCPLGAGAGGGTSLPIDPSITAGLLGFRQSSPQSLQAVAGRESTILLASAVASASICLSRMAQDMQVWTAPGVDIGDFPDELSGTSSMLPQKRNPYLLEHIKSLGVRVTSAAAECLSVFSKVPFSNSVEVTSFSAAVVHRLIEAFMVMCRLSAYAVTHFETLPSAATLDENPVYAAQILAEQAAAAGNSSVASHHHEIAECLRGPDPDLSRWSAPLTSGRAGISLRYDTFLKYGGGPGQGNVQSYLGARHERLAKDEAELRSLEAEWEGAGRRRLDQLMSIENAALSGLEVANDGDHSLHP